MRLLSALFLLFSALGASAANEEFREPIVPKIAVVKPVIPGAEIKQVGAQISIEPQIAAPQEASVGTANLPQSPEVPLNAQLGIKKDDPLAPALSPVSDAAASGDPQAAEDDWRNRAGERPLNIVLAAAESVPLIKTGGLADVIDAIGRGFAARGHQVSLFLPKHAQVKTGGIQFRKLDRGIDVPVAGRVEKAALWEADHQGVRIFLVEHDGFFKRDSPYGSYMGDYPDSDERFIFFSRAVLESAKALELKPDIVHSHDWHAALTAPMLKLLYANDPAFSGAKAVVTLHNIAYQGNFTAESFEKAGFESKHFTADALEHKGYFNFLQGGIRYADAVTTVSPTYAKEIQNDPTFGMGLETVLKGRAEDLQGIINGVDHEMWDPETDGVIGRNYGPRDVAQGKAAAKKALQQSAGLKIDPDAPLFGVAARLAHQKGLDLVSKVTETLIKMNGQLFVLGSGDKKLEEEFKALAAKYPDAVYVHPFDEWLPRRVFAAADFLFMPSRFEPCGLSQLMAQRYGTLPIVTKTGGLNDTVTDVRESREFGDGLFVKEFTPEALTETVIAAFEHYRKPLELEYSRRAAMMKDSSWDGSVERYLSLFRSLLRKDSPAPPPQAAEKPREEKRGLWERARAWFSQLNRALDARSKAEKILWISIFAAAGLAAIFPMLWGAAALPSALLSLGAALAPPFLALNGVLAARIIAFLRHGLPYKPNPLGRRLRSAMIGLMIGLTLGAAPFALRPVLVEQGAKIVAADQQITRVRGDAMQKELERRFSQNPVGRKVLDGLRDRSGVIRWPDFYVSKQSDSVAAEHVVVDGVFIDLPNVTSHRWTAAEFARDPAKQLAVVDELEVTLLHELTHAVQARRVPASLGEARDTFRIHLNLEAEYEAYLNEHLYTFEKLKADPHAKLAGDEWGNFLSAVDGLDGFFRSVDSSYPKDKHIDTAYYREFFAAQRAGWPAHQVECYVLQAKRVLPGSPRNAERLLETARKIARQNDLPEPSLDIPGAPLAAPAAK